MRSKLYYFSHRSQKCPLHVCIHVCIHAQCGSGISYIFDPFFDAQYCGHITETQVFDRNPFPDRISDGSRVLRSAPTLNHQARSNRVFFGSKKT